MMSVFTCCPNLKGGSGAFVYGAAVDGFWYDWQGRMFHAKDLILGGSVAFFFTSRYTYEKE